MLISFFFFKGKHKYHCATMREDQNAEAQPDQQGMFIRLSVFMHTAWIIYYINCWLVSHWFVLSGLKEHTIFFLRCDSCWASQLGLHTRWETPVWKPRESSAGGIQIKEQEVNQCVFFLFKMNVVIDLTFVFIITVIKGRRKKSLISQKRNR